MFWRRLGKIIAHDDACCDEDFAEEFVTSIGNYLKVSLNANVGTPEELFAYEASVNKKGSPWLPQEQDVSPPVKQAGSAAAAGTSEQAAGMTRAESGNIQAATIISGQPTGTQPAGTQKPKKAGKKQSEPLREKRHRDRKVPDRLDPMEPVKPAKKSKKVSEPVVIVIEDEIPPESAAKKPRKYTRKQANIYPLDRGSQNSLEPPKTPQTPSITLTASTPSNPSNYRINAPPVASDSSNVNGQSSGSVNVAKTDDECFDFVEKQMSRAHKL